VDLARRSGEAIDARHADVDVRPGVVCASGVVWSAADRCEARRVAANVPGVTGVVNQLELMGGGRTGAR